MDKTRNRLLPALLGPEVWFPDPQLPSAPGAPDGLVAIGGDLSVERLLLAYRSGVFPWTALPITWWCPQPRAIFELSRFHVSGSLRRILRRCAFSPDPGASREPPGLAAAADPRGFRVTLDRAFRAVITGCSQPGANRGKTWISSGFIEAYTRLHEAGHAHSVECWQGDMLAGGIYGVAIGGLFAGESMFHRASDASKVALCFLIQQLRERGFGLFDIQMLTPITTQLGAVEIPRAAYLERLRGVLELQCSFWPPGHPPQSQEPLGG